MLGHEPLEASPGELGELGIANGINRLCPQFAGEDSGITHNFTRSKFGDRDLFSATFANSNANSAADDKTKKVPRVAFEKQNLASVECEQFKFFAEIAKSISAEALKQVAQVQGKREMVSLKALAEHLHCV